MLASALRYSALRGLRGFATAVESSFKVAAVDAGQPSSAVTVLVKAGSRYETKPGVAHVLKNFAFKNTSKRSALRTVRESELYGGVLSAYLGREHLAITAEFLRGDEDFFVELLSSLFTSTQFTSHELHESVIPSVQAESITASTDSATHALEVAHALAFRSGLGQSLFAGPHADFTPEDVKSFASKTFAKDNLAIIGTGIDAGVLGKLVEKHFGSVSPSSSLPTSSTVYYGGESHAFSGTSGSPTLFIGYGTPIPSPELAVLAAHLDPTPSLKWSVGTSPLASLATIGASASVVLLPYSDAALFGLLVQAPSVEGLKEAGKVAVKALKDAAAGAVKGDELTKSIAKAKYNAVKSLENRDGVLWSLGPQLLAGSNPSLESVTSPFDKLSATAISKAVSSIQKSKPVFVAVGDAHGLPYADELGL